MYEWSGFLLTKGMERDTECYTIVLNFFKLLSILKCAYHWTKKIEWNKADCKINYYHTCMRWFDLAYAVRVPQPPFEGKPPFFNKSPFQIIMTITHLLTVSCVLLNIFFTVPLLNPSKTKKLFGVQKALFSLMNNNKGAMKK